MTADDKFDIRLMEASFSPWAPQKGPSRQIAVLMSGGVDSSVSAHLLKQAGWDVLGITMKIPVSCGANVRGCCGADAAFVCNEMGIAHYFVDVTGVFEELIIQRFRTAYAEGRTPNPCIDCNTLLKFSLVWDLLESEFGIKYLATGHYARLIAAGGRVRLARAADKAKDQSYFLYGIARDKLQRLVLPLGEFEKSKVRSMAAELNLSAAEKPESMELCFAGEGDYRSALCGRQADVAGDITDMQGRKIGEHKGISHYTLGQRKGIGFAGGKPLYVGRIGAKSNTIALGTRDQVSSRDVCAEDINVLIPQELEAGRQLWGKIRSYGEPRPCRLVEVGEDSVTVEFAEAQFAPCAGQRLVLYNQQEAILFGLLFLGVLRHD